MLVISRRIGESFVIGDDMEVMVIDITGQKVVLGVAAPRSTPVTRVEASEDGIASSINQRGYGRQIRKRIDGVSSGEDR